MIDEVSHQEGFFRENALKYISASTEIGKSLKVVGVRLNIYLAVVISILIAVTLWCLKGIISVEVPASGLMMPLHQLEASEEREREVRVEREQTFNSLKTLYDKKKMLYEKHYLTIDDLAKARQDYLNAEEKLLTVPPVEIAPSVAFLSSEQNLKSPQLEALVFVNHAEGKKVARGMRALILPSTLSSYQFGYIKGKVKSISEFPASKESVYSYLGNRSLVDEYFANGVPFLVKIELDKNADTKSGLNWTSRLGTPYLIEAGSAVTAKIINHEYHPFQLLFPRSSSGSL